MATIQKLERKNGARYRVLIRRTGHKAVTRVFDRKKDAETWARVMEGDLNVLDDFPNAIARRQTVADAVDGFVKAHTGKDAIILSRLAWWRGEYGALPLARFTQSTVKDGLKTLASQPARMGAGKGKSRDMGKLKSAATVNRYHVAISSALEWAKRENWITRNPARGIVRGGESRGRTRFLKDTEREALLTACDASTWPDLGLLVRLALSTGARLAELLTLTWADLDLERGAATIGDSKNGEARTLPLVSAVRALLEKKPAEARVGLVFPSPRKTGKPYAFRAVWVEAVTAAGLKDFRFHDLRHSCASYLAMSGASAVQIADVLGHKTLQMVQRYSHLNYEHKAELMERVTGGLVK